jgi:hypothetical protein
VAAADDKATARAPDPVVADGASPSQEGEPAARAVPARDVRVSFAAPTTSGEVVLVPPEEEVSGERPALVEEEHFVEAEPTAPRRAADVLPPRNRREVPREDRDTPPRGLRLVGDGRDDDSQTSQGERPNKRPSSAPRPVLGRPLFEQEWGTSSQGTPTWRPGAPPTDLEPSRENWWIVGGFALVGVGAIVLWLWWWT